MDMLHAISAISIVITPETSCRIENLHKIFRNSFLGIDIHGGCDIIGVINCLFLRITEHYEQY